MDWLVVAVGLIGFVLAGQKLWWAWYVNLAGQTLWFTYGYITEQYAFVASSLIYAVVFGRNAYRWTKEHRKTHEEVLAEPAPVYTPVHDTDWAAKNPIHTNGDKPTLYLRIYEHLTDAITKVADESNVQCDIDTRHDNGDLVVCWSWPGDNKVQMLKAEVSTNFLRISDGLPPEPDTHRKGRFQVPDDVVYWRDNAEQYVQDYFHAMELEKGAHITLHAWRDLDQAITWVEWESDVPVKGDLDPFKAEKHPMQPIGERYLQAKYERLGESDQGPVFFSDEELNLSSTLVKTLYTELQARANELGCSVEMRVEAKPGGVLVHWDWK